MSEPTLTAAWTDLQGDVSFFLGYGRGPAFKDPVLTPQQQASVDRSVKGGMRKFYFCDYPWSFLRPVASLALPSGQKIIALPDDFGGVEGQMTVSSPQTIVWYPIDFGLINRVYQMEATEPTTTGRPQLACVEPLKGTAGDRSHRSQLHFWPISDGAYTIQFMYYISPDYLSGAFPFAYGGPEHSETLLEACLSVAEKILDDAADVHDQEFARMLATSKMIDSRKKPQNLGYNDDKSDARARRFIRPQTGTAFITVNGTLY